MSFSVFYAVRFSPAPELGEWLNVAVVGEGINERKAGVIVCDSMERIATAFGDEAVERVKAICTDLTHLVAETVSAYDRGEVTQPIPSAMRDQALSLSFSEQIMVFDGPFEEALAAIAKKYLAPPEYEADALTMQENLSEEEAEGESDVAKIANALQDKLAKFSKDIFPSTLGKTIEQGHKVFENLVNAPEVTTVLVIGGAGHLGSALLPRILERGERVRLYHPSESGPTVIEIKDPHAPSSIAEIAKRAGVTTESVGAVLNGASERLGVNPKTADKIREIAAKLGLKGETPGVTKLSLDDHVASMRGIDVAVYIPEGVTRTSSSGPMDRLQEAIQFAQSAKDDGVKRFVIATSTTFGDASQEDPNKALHELGDDQFTITILNLGELYGHANATQWFGDLRSKTQTINVLTAKAVLSGTVDVEDSNPKPFLHVEDAVESIVAVIDAPVGVVNGQTYSVGSEDQIRTVREIAHLIKLHAPNADFVITACELDSTTLRGDLSKIYDELGFSPTRTLEEGISQTIRALQDGSVSNYMSSKSADPEVRVSAEPGGPVSEIQWERLKITTVEVEHSPLSTDQSIQN